MIRVWWHRARRHRVVRHERFPWPCVDCEFCGKTLRADSIKRHQREACKAIARAAATGDEGGKRQ